MYDIAVKRISSLDQAQPNELQKSYIMDTHSGPTIPANSD